MAKKRDQSEGTSEQLSLAELASEYAQLESAISEGGGAKGIARQHGHGRLTARERIEKLVDAGTEPMELGIWAAWNMYTEYGGAPGAGVVTVIGQVGGRLG